jgi:Ca-activated chloride channel family protein
MSWGAPAYLHLLWLMLPLSMMLWTLGARRRRRLRQLGEPAALNRLRTRTLPRRGPLRPLLSLSAIALLMVALARPQWGEYWQDVHTRGLDILVALDTSKSMLAEDLQPNRLQQAKLGILDLLDRLEGDRVGLVAFAGTSFLQCPLTIDYAAFRMSLDDTYIGIIPQGGTALGHTLDTCIRSFDPESNSDQVILLITDGENHVDDPLARIAELRTTNIRVFAIGVGSEEGELIPVQSRGGAIEYLKDRDGNVVKTSLQEPVLRELAVRTGGVYVRAVPGDFGAEAIVERGLAQLDRTEGQERRMKLLHDRYPWAVGAALLLLGWEAALGPTRWKPRRESP